MTFESLTTHRKASAKTVGTYSALIRMNDLERSRAWKKDVGEEIYFTVGKSMGVEEADCFRVIFSREDNVKKEGLKRS